ncbi:uncharacterized protein LOC143244046 isoform X2 [Tachypleus tridentatus]|uniref:uncharacterized protein LOC143244046 isoform X2 n=1 Tax=Tachypleus tridentatus TaxID=6853 RepID=UPI003FD35936
MNLGLKFHWVVLLVSVELTMESKHENHSHYKVRKDSPSNVFHHDQLLHDQQLHDMDNNNKLDGLEILAAINHMIDDEIDDYLTEIPISNDIPASRSEQEKWNIKFDKDSVFIDKILQEDDLNKDGFLTYSEFASGRLRDISN